MLKSSDPAARIFVGGCGPGEITAVVGDSRGPLEIAPAVIAELRSRGNEFGEVEFEAAEKRRALEVGTKIRIAVGSRVGYRGSGASKVGE